MTLFRRPLHHLLLFFLSLLLLFPHPLSAQQNQVTVYFFWAKGCPHCAAEKPFLEKLSQKYPIEVKSFEITTNQKNRQLLQQTAIRLGAQSQAGFVPFTVIGDHYIVGFLDENTTGRQIEQAIQCALEQGCQDVVANLLTAPSPTPTPHPLPESLRLPLVGTVSLKNLSLPLLTVLFGLLDGFNPCAMWTLLFLISLLLGMKNRRRMWLLGFTFIAASAAVYFLFMAAWLNFFLLLGFILWVRLAIGIVALFAGGYNLRQYFKNKEGGCEVVADEKRRRTFEKIKKITHKKQLALALAGIVLLAVAVNLVELICSAGLPAVYTQILALNRLPTWQYYFYLLLYIFFFMIDDLGVFVAAMITLHMVGLSSKYARYSHLIGGLLMLLIGLALLFKPQLLMFG